MHLVEAMNAERQTRNERDTVMTEKEAEELELEPFIAEAMVGRGITVAEFKKMSPRNLLKEVVGWELGDPSEVVGWEFGDPSWVDAFERWEKSIRKAKGVR